MGPIGLKAHLAPVHGRPRGHRPAARPSECRPGRRVGRPVRLGVDPADLVDVHHHDGRRGLTRATEVAILNANYVASQLGGHYPVLYTGSQGRVAHECILDIRPIKAATGISEVDIAKRLMDYGFHAPTMSFPVAGTIMVETDRIRGQGELDRFIAAMVDPGEIRAIEEGRVPPTTTRSKRPHTQADFIGDWTAPIPAPKPPSRCRGWATNKFWPSVNRIDDVYGDRNLFCACVPMDELS